MNDYDRSLARRAWNTAWVGATLVSERRLDQWSPERLQRVADRRARRIAAFAARTVPFYREAFADAGVSAREIRGVRDLSALPLIDGATVRERPLDFASTAFDDRSREPYHSSGTDHGVRRTVFRDDRYILRTLVTAERERATFVALTGEARGRTALRELLPSRGADHPVRTKLTVFHGSASARVARVVWSERTLLPARAGHHLYLQAPLPFAGIVAALDHHRPRVVYSFGSFAEAFLRELDLRGNDVALPQLWVYTSDAMSPVARAIGESRGCAIVSTYGSIEADRIGVQCERRDGYHLNVDHLAIRIVRPDGTTAAAGESGEVVVSNLINRATVLLNYSLGDRGTAAAAPCPCGRSRPLLAQLDGRCSESFATVDRGQISSLALEGMLREPLKPALKVQFVREGPELLRLRVVPLGRLDVQLVERDATEKLAHLFGERHRVVVELVDRIDTTATGKHRRGLNP